uniref:Lipopolysaccharide export system protein LptC n=1 Tax=Candidatus Kentrum sp. SD TaxID=2126332 RepID=A0A450YI24_9GAMM|nr:MAG: lipopolysaccharide export system protein LptC [Candidatus Kentron sp. SD]VFK46939.1 MAG: lipopolysaccharide export system protein LptC [Candidatus Kentron sp. SD]VFK78200.1 MAG: lipopolysaccharide export system protein LptC [Candidatus Kentron sp. SD]
MMKRWLLPLWLLVLLLGSSWLLDRLTVDSESEGDIQEEKYDYSMGDFTTTSMDEMGRPKYRLTAVRMVHYPTGDTSELEKPYLILFDTDIQDRSQKIPIDRDRLPSTYQAWHIESEEGRILGNGRVIFLFGRVHLWKNDDAGTTKIDVRTRNLRLFPDLDYGETDETIIIRTPTTETHGVGMRAYVRPSRIELLSRVETIYEETPYQ